MSVVTHGHEPSKIKTWNTYGIGVSDHAARLLLGLSVNQPVVFFSHTKLAPVISLSAVIFFHNKIA